MKTFLLGLALIAAPAAAQMQGMAMPAPACTAPVIVPGFEGWGKGAPTPQLKLGATSSLVLAPAEAVKFSPPLNRAPQPGQRGGVYGITLDKPGSYRFALSEGAWLDVINGKGERMPSAAHMHGPACSGIAKIVDYQLDGGVYVVQFSGTMAPKIQVMLIGG
ncbi:hypothetical protein FHS31_001573 [Sphingomonas vulcanisoli]|uniref:Homogentisate 1,2-dioxygenase n=1 Tax=Sphingomonas vulcanisoli TaxID=1658060 RepID=A0ABX0TR10_9SPHN|nr:hypothetical protein [Sphingomonas vulcanisoli]NIJ07963.1 hypothetical protein [Sphingomonas vulcanisoli]